MPFGISESDFLREGKFVAIQFLVADLLGRTNEWDSGQQFAIEPLMAGRR